MNLARPCVHPALMGTRPAPVRRHSTVRYYSDQITPSCAKIHKRWTLYPIRHEHSMHGCGYCTLFYIFIWNPPYGSDYQGKFRGNVFNYLRHLNRIIRINLINIRYTLEVLVPIIIMTKVQTSSERTTVFAIFFNSGSSSSKSIVTMRVSRLYKALSTSRNH